MTKYMSFWMYKQIHTPAQEQEGGGGQYCATRNTPFTEEINFSTIYNNSSADIMICDIASL